MTNLSDAISNSHPDDPASIDCGFPHDYDGECGEASPERNRPCSRRPGHDGPHTHCGHWKCKYVVWTDDGKVLHDHWGDLLDMFAAEGKQP